MKHEFKKIKGHNETRYVLENASAGATGASSVASVSSPLGGVRRRSKDNILAQEADKTTIPTEKPRNFVAKNAKMGGAGAHKDKKKAAKQGDVKHKNKQLDLAEDNAGISKEKETKFHANLDKLVHNTFGKRKGEMEGHDKPDHEISMASNELQAIAKNAVHLLDLVRRYSEQEGLQAWQQSKITKAADYLTSVLQSISGEQGVAEGGVLKSIKRGLQGWQGSSHLDDIQDYIRNASDETLVRLYKDPGESPYKQTPRDIQIKLINRELKRRYGVKPGEQGVAEGSDNIRSMIQQYEDMVELVYDLPPGRKKNIAIDKRDALEAQIEAMPGGSEALRKWAKSYNDAMDEGVAEGVEIIDQDSDLDQQVYTLNVDGNKVSFTYWDYENNFQSPDIKDIYQQAKEQLGKKLSPEQVKAVARAVFKSFEQGVAEYGDTARGQKMLTKVQHRAVNRMIKAADKGDAKNAKKNQDTANRAWDRMDTSEAEGSAGWHPSSTVKNPNFNDELSGRRVSPPGRRLKTGKLSADERGSQERTKALMKHTQKKGGLTGPKGHLPEEQGYDEVSPKSASFILRKLEQDVPMSDILDDFPELWRMMELIAGERGLHMDDDFEQIEDILRNDLEDIAAQEDDFGDYDQDEEVREGGSDFVGNAIHDLRVDKPGMDKESFLDELYFYLDAEYGKQAADMVANAREEDHDEWYADYTDMTEAAPKGWEKTVKAMKKHDEIDNPWALAHWMKSKGYKSHKEDAYMQELSTKLSEKLDPNADPDVWVQDFQKADPSRYHQFRNKSPEKKAQMAIAARYAAKQPKNK